MEKYRNFRPTGFDCQGLGAERHGIGDFGVLIARNRDSDCLAESNFSVALKRLGGESEDVQVHRFGHWANGWFELILIRPGTKEFELAKKMESALWDYPVLDEEDYSERRWNTAARCWEHMRLKERVEVCQRFRVSVFAARHDNIPDDDAGGIIDYLSE